MGVMNIINLYDNYNEREREAKNHFLLPKERVKTAKACYNSYFNSDLKAIFNLLSNIATEKNYKIYLIGGIVRDLLLNKKNLDIDITVEGDAIAFAQILAKDCGAKISSTHKDFGTVKIELNGVKIDLASTRSESYPKKGHLPRVDEIGCSLEKDLLRRDFTINSLALSLNKENFAHLIDYVGGFEDLKAKKIRILHDKSFIDDPTRIVRALKFSARLGFEIEAHTLKLRNEYLENINYDMGQKRLKSEIKQTFDLNLQSTFDEFMTKKIYKLLTSKKIEPPELNIENLIQKYPCKHHWLVYLGVIALQEDNKFLDKLELTKIERNVLESAKNLLGADLKDDYQIYKAFNMQKLESLLIYAIYRGEKEISHYLADLKKIKLSINGDDILKMGCKPSKLLGAALEYVLKRKLMCPNIKREDELELALKYLKC